MINFLTLGVLCTEIMSSEIMNGQRAKTWRNTMRESVNPSKTQTRAPKVGGFAAHFSCGFFEFWKGGRRSRVAFLEDFARWPLILSDEKKKKHARARAGRNFDCFLFLPINQHQADKSIFLSLCRMGIQAHAHCEGSRNDFGADLPGRRRTQRACSH